MRMHFRVKNIIIFIISLTLLYQDYCTCMTKCISYYKIVCAYSIFRSLIPITSPVMQTRFSTPPTILRRGRKRKVSFCWVIPLIIFFNNFCQECRVWGHKILLLLTPPLPRAAWSSGLSLRAGGGGLSPATKRVAPCYFYWKIEEK